ncbi:unnamed protein product [[Candida] boidinii]|nr:hypothetical protein BVG19_g3898 [[Candida] boidinii]OWB51025.1 hypothetical protein B5S27_g2582 [[Candida] boidinii]GMF34412.1 unnamed protein product [[Candida] boidinii]
MSDQVIGTEEEEKSDTDLNNLHGDSSKSTDISPTPIPIPEPTPITSTDIIHNDNDNANNRVSSINVETISKRTKDSSMSSSDLSELGNATDDQFVTATEDAIEPNRVSDRSIITSTDLESSEDDEEIVEMSGRRRKRQKIRNLDDDDGDSELNTSNKNNQRDTTNDLDFDIVEDDSIIISDEVPIIRRSDKIRDRRVVDSSSGSTRGSTTPGTGSSSVFQSEGIEIQELDSDNDNDNDDDDITTTSGSRSTTTTNNKDETDEDTDDIIIISSNGEIEKSRTTIDLLNDSVENTAKELKDVVCPICFEPFEKCVVMSCGHLYCSDCIYETLASSKIRNVNQGICALCRKTVFYKDLVWLKLRYKK